MAFLNSYLAQFAVNLYCGQHKTGGYVGELPIAKAIISDSILKSSAFTIYNLKRDWDLGSETNKDFTEPWLLLVKQDQWVSKLQSIKISTLSITLHQEIDFLLGLEETLDNEIRNLQSKIESKIYDYYEIPREDQTLIEKELQNRPQVVLWPYAYKLERELKATEHTSRLISHFLLKAIQSDPDGILPLTESSGHGTVLRHVQAGLETHFGESAAYQVELDSAAYLGRPLDEWLLKSFWKEFHVKWYKNRPILWQIQSPKGHFACLVHTHKMDRDTLPKLRSQYLWPARSACQAALESARLREASGERSAAKEVAKYEAILDDLSDFERRLGDVIEARVKCAIPAWAQGPYRHGVFDPVLDDGVAVNILPLQEAGILAKAKVV